MVGSPDTRVEHKHQVGDAGRLAGLKVQRDLGSLPSTPFVIFLIIDQHAETSGGWIWLPPPQGVSCLGNTQPSLLSLLLIGCAWGEPPGW